MARKKPMGWGTMLVLVLLGAAVALLVARDLRRGSAPASKAGPSEVKPDRGEQNKGKESGDLAYLADDIPGLRQDSLPPGRYSIIACNEHVEDEESAGLLLQAMDALGVGRALLMGSPEFTFTGDPDDGLGGFRENNELILKLAAAHPARFSAFVTLHPPDEDRLALLQGYVGRGAAGLRLYLGRGGKAGGQAFHMMPLDAPAMLPVYRFCEQRSLPLVIDVNLNKFLDELERLLKAFPRLRVMVTHWGIYKNSTKKLDTLSRLIEAYPGLFLGLSFGGTRWQVQGFEKLARWPRRYARFLSRHEDRFLFSGSTVVSMDIAEDYPLRLLRSYRQLLEMKAFRFYEKSTRPMRGLQLNDRTLKRIYEEGPARFLGGL